MSLALILFATVFASQDSTDLLDKSVSFKCVATRAVNLMPQLSKATGLSLSVDTKVGDEPLVIQVKDVKGKVDEKQRNLQARASN